MDIAARQLSGAQRQLGQGGEDLALEMQHAMGQVMADRGKAAMQMRGLAAFGAIIARHRRAAIQAGAMAGLMGFPMAWLDRPCQHAPGDRVTRCFDFPCHGRGR